MEALSVVWRQAEVSMSSPAKRAIKSTIIDEVFEALRAGFAVKREDNFTIHVIIGSSDKPTCFEVTVKEKKSAHGIHSRDHN